MVDETSRAAAWSVEYTGIELQPLATSLAKELRGAGIAAEEPGITSRPATLGTPEILITIVVTAAAKAIIVAGLHAVQAVLEREIDKGSNGRAQIILASSGAQKERFPVSLRSLGKDALKEFISDIVSAVNKF